MLMNYVIQHYLYIIWTIIIILKGDRTTTNYDNNEVKFKHCDLIA